MNVMMMQICSIGDSVSKRYALTPLLKFNTFLTLDSKSQVPSAVALAMVLHSMASPCRQGTIARAFNVSTSTVSRAISAAVEHLINHFSSFVELWPGLSHSKVQEYERAINSHYNWIEQLFAFIDGTVREIAVQIIFVKLY